MKSRIVERVERVSMIGNIVRKTFVNLANGQISFFQQWPMPTSLEVKIMQDNGEYRITTYIYKEDIEKLVDFLQGQLDGFRDQTLDQNSSTLDYLDSRLDE